MCTLTMGIISIDFIQSKPSHGQAWTMIWDIVWKNLYMRNSYILCVCELLNGDLGYIVVAISESEILRCLNEFYHQGPAFPERKINVPKMPTHWANSTHNFNSMNDLNSYCWWMYFEYKWGKFYELKRKKSLKFIVMVDWLLKLSLEKKFKSTHSKKEWKKNEEW